MPKTKKHTAKRKPGRPSTGRKVKKFTVVLPPELHEWAMQQHEGFSALTRRLLQDERTKCQ